MKIISVLLGTAKNKSSNVLVVGTVIVTIGTFINSIFSYLLQISLGRMLSVTEYGTFNALLSLSVLLVVPGAALMNSIIKTVAELKAKNRFDILTHLFLKSSVGTLFIGLIIFFLVYSFRSFLAEYLNVSDKSIFLFFGFYLGISFLNINPAAYLQGLLRFKAFALFMAVGGFLRFSSAVIFVALGFDLSGVFMGMFLGILVSFFIALLLLKKNFEKFEPKSLSQQYKRIIRFGFVTLFVGVGMNLLNNIDVILVKHFFTGEEAGIYSAVVTVGKVFLFGAGTVTVLMYPQISGLFARSENFLPRFKQFLGIQLALIAFGAVTFSVFAKFIVKVLFGTNFLSAVPFIPHFTIFVAFYILINFLIMFLLAINNKKVWAFLLPAVVGQYVLINLKHQTINDIININIIVSGVLLVIITMYCLHVIKNARINYSSSI